MDKQNEEQDSINWGTAGKSSARKVYGDIAKAPKVMGLKVIRMNLLEKLALGEITQEQYEKMIGD